MTERARIYIGGPLNGQAAEKVNGTWPRFRAGNGDSLDAGIEGLTPEETAQFHAYYEAVLPGEGAGWGYVHKSLWQDYLRAFVFASAVTQAIVEHRRTSESATG